MFHIFIRKCMKASGNQANLHGECVYLFAFVICIVHANVLLQQKMLLGSYWSGPVRIMMTSLLTLRQSSLLTSDIASPASDAPTGFLTLKQQSGNIMDVPVTKMWPRLANWGKLRLKDIANIILHKSMKTLFLNPKLAQVGQTLHHLFYNNKYFFSWSVHVNNNVLTLADLLLRFSQTPQLHNRCMWKYVCCRACQFCRHMFNV